MGRSRRADGVQRCACRRFLSIAWAQPPDQPGESSPAFGLARTVRSGKPDPDAATAPAMFASTPKKKSSWFPWHRDKSEEPAAAEPAPETGPATSGGLASKPASPRGRDRHFPPPQPVTDPAAVAAVKGSRPLPQRRRRRIANPCSSRCPNLPAGYHLATVTRRSRPSQSGRRWPTTIRLHLAGPHRDSP